jgi:hypothetical protein
MAKEKKNKTKANDISPNSLGGKIKKYRNYRQYTQEQLGQLAGFPQTTAQIRIGQYEANKKVPGDDSLSGIAKGLGIKKEALSDVDYSSKDVMYQALFELEDNFGLCPREVDNHYVLDFIKTADSEDAIKLSNSEEEFLAEWSKVKKMFLPSKYDTEEEKKEKKKRYALWKASYPSQVSDQLLEERAKEKGDDLEAQIKFDNALLEFKGDKVKKSLEEAVDPVFADVKAKYVPLKYESELIFFIEEMMSSGIIIKKRSPELTTKGHPGYVHFLSIKIEEILEDPEKTKLYAKFLCILQQFRDSGTEFINFLICREESFYISFMYSVRSKLRFPNLEKDWNIIELYAERIRDNWPEEDINTDRKLLAEHITGEFDHKLF